MKNEPRLIYIVLILLVSASFVYAGTLTLTTYYPAPTGNYDQLTATNIGIGVAPVANKRLEVSGDIRSRGTGSHFFGNDDLASIQASANTTPDIKFLTNGVEVMRITNANGGRIGIGNTAPAAKIDVAGIGGTDDLNLLPIFYWQQEIGRAHV